jgi:ATP-dependent Lon protease
MIFPLNVGREKSKRALEEARAKDRIIVLVAQKEAVVEDPGPEDIYEVGLAAEVMHVLNVPDMTVRVMFEGLARVRIKKYLQSEPYFLCEVEELTEEEEKTVETEALMRSVMSQFQQIVEIGKNIPPEVILNVSHVDDPGRLADMVTPNLGLKVPAKQEILETTSPRERLIKLSVMLQREIEILDVQRDIREKVEREMGETQKEFFLREQLKTIQQELGERDERGTEVEDYRAKIEEAGMPEEVRERALKEVDRLEKMPFAAPEGVVIRTYLDWLVALPWSVAAEERLDIPTAHQVLDEDHYGLAKVKDRILEFLAVRKLAGTLRGPILCFAGPPGVGKTSIGKSIARALGRKFIRVSLGGVRDEAEIRGHRRTYIGALPGRIIQGIKQAGNNNPVFMLDEIDKMGQDFRGDPSAALLEALDPEQNNAFSDHYLEVPFDLSDVMFITTANLLDPIPPALRDRMEVISFPGYTEEEKLEIAKGFLVPKQMRDHGLIPSAEKPEGEETHEVVGESAAPTSVTAEVPEANAPKADGAESPYLAIGESALQRIIREYTRESGVRNLEREIATICRKVARKVAEGETEKITVGAEAVPDYLGPKRYTFGLAEEQDEIGAATGLTWSEVGGDVISVEATLMRGKGKLTLTGQLGDVMKESAEAALSYCRSRSEALGLDENFYRRLDIHIHVPAGAIPKDGPSAGITLATALASALTRRPVRRDVAMTGEITLRGKVLPIGGLKEKALAAHRAGIRTVIIPKENEKDLSEIPDKVKTDLEFKRVSHMDQVLEIALAEGPGPEPRPARASNPALRTSLPA